MFNSAAVDVTRVLFNLSPASTPLCPVTSTFPPEVNPVKVPTWVTWDKAAFTLIVSPITDIPSPPVIEDAPVN